MREAPLAAVPQIIEGRAAADRIDAAVAERAEPTYHGRRSAHLTGQVEFDRVVFGYVRDMIHAVPGVHWPGSWTVPFTDYPGSSRAVFPWIFNVADILLCTGVALMIIYSLLHSGREPQNISEPAAKPQTNTDARR